MLAWALILLWYDAYVAAGGQRLSGCEAILPVLNFNHLKCCFHPVLIPDDILKSCSGDNDERNASYKTCTVECFFKRLHCLNGNIVNPIAFEKTVRKTVSPQWMEIVRNVINMCYANTRQTVSNPMGDVVWEDICTFQPWSFYSCIQMNLASFCYNRNYENLRICVMKRNNESTQIPCEL